MIALLLAFASAQDDSVELRRLEMAVSKSRGKTDGVVVMWPRVIPASTDNEVTAVANELQQRMAEIAKRAAPLATRDLRPEPERVCPRARGCRATSLGVLLGQQDGGCVAVAVLGPPGETDLELYPLAGTVDLASKTVPFRSPPENSVTVREFVPCSKLVSLVDDSALVLRMRQLVRE
ncbi:MAG: hypothetical protein H6737_13660 [Alphaproteobacteria bacterium]|nr:hypothetical protein [Alphaproteobacteria bacterium]